jgi:hypothetical protein
VRRAGVHIDFHADRQFNDPRGPPGHFSVPNSSCKTQVVD